jgi:putative MFS transporter
MPGSYPARRAGIPIARTLSQSLAISIGVIPGAFIASVIADRWERKYLIALVAVLVGTFGCLRLELQHLDHRHVWLSGGDGSAGVRTDVVCLHGRVLSHQRAQHGAGLSYGIGRLGNAVGPLIVAFLYSTYGYRSVFAYIAVCWVMVALLIMAFGPRMNAGRLPEHVATHRTPTLH